jgi:hypothetical protein
VNNQKNQSEENGTNHSNDELDWSALERTDPEKQNLGEDNHPATASHKKEPKSHKTLIITLSIIGGILLLAIVGFFGAKQLGLFGQTGNSTSSQNSSNPEDLKKLYNDLINSYVAAGKSDNEIIELLKKAAAETGDQSYINDQNSYLVKKPSFSLAPGTYEGSQVLTINKNNTSDTISYTLDGSNPTASSMTYAGPITLPIGETTVKAVAISNKGILSAVAEGKYTLTSTQNSTQSVLTPDEFINRLYGVWYDESTGSVLMVSQTNFYDYIPKPQTVATGAFVVVSTTDNGGTINVKNLTVDGSNLGDTLVNVDFGTPGDDKIRWQYDGKIWHDDTAAESLGGGQYRIPFKFAGTDIFTMK